MPDFDVSVTFTVCDVTDQHEAVAVVQKILEPLGVGGASFHPVPADVVESEPR
jgi:hypothetical protein